MVVVTDLFRGLLCTRSIRPECLHLFQHSASCSVLAGCVLAYAGYASQMERTWVFHTEFVGIMETLMRGGRAYFFCLVLTWSWEISEGPKWQEVLSKDPWYIKASSSHTHSRNFCVSIHCSRKSLLTLNICFAYQGKYIKAGAIIKPPRLLWCTSVLITSKWIFSL